MPVLKNARHEAFAQARAKGSSADDAYKAAGYKAHSGNAARMSGNESVRSRVSELQSRGAQKVEVTTASIAAELDEARALAIKLEQPAAMTQASMGKAKLFGLVVDRKHHTGAIGTYDLSKVTDAELDSLESILGPLADIGGDQGGEGKTQH